MTSLQIVQGWVATAIGDCLRISRRQTFDSEQRRSLLDDMELHHRSLIRRDDAAEELRRRIQSAEFDEQRRFEYDVDHDLAVLKNASEDDELADIRDSKREERPEDQSSRCPSKSDSDDCSRGESPTDSVNNMFVSNSSRDSASSELSNARGSSVEAAELRAWLASINETQSMEYLAYAIGFESEGFYSLRDISDIDRCDVDRAIEAVGVTKFAHRSKLRKEIIRLSEHRAQGLVEH